MNGWPDAVTGIIGALVGALVVWLLGRGKAEAEPVKMHAEATEAITDAADKMLSQMRREIDRLNGRVSCLEAEVEELTKERDELKGRLRRLENGAAHNGPQGPTGAGT